MWSNYVMILRGYGWQIRRKACAGYTLFSKNTTELVWNRTLASTVKGRPPDSIKPVKNYIISVKIAWSWSELNLAYPLRKQECQHANSWQLGFCWSCPFTFVTKDINIFPILTSKIYTSFLATSAMNSINAVQIEILHRSKYGCML